MNRRRFILGGTGPEARRTVTTTGLSGTAGAGGSNRPKTTTGFFYDRMQTTPNSYPPWENDATGASFTPRRPYTGQPIPANFHEYHFRSSYMGDTAGPSRLDTAATGVMRTAPRRSMSTTSTPHNAEFGFEDGTNFPTRTWEHTGLGSLLSTKKNDPTLMGGGVRFTIMCYNILAPGLLEKHPELYKKCERASLDWDYRVMRIFHEINQYLPDVVCLQEVEAGQLLRIIEPRFNHLGFRGVFKKKTGDKDDGCAIFYRTSKFLLIDKLEVEMLQPHVPLLNRDNVGLLVKLETRNVPRRQKIVVGTTHLLFNQKRQEVRIAQIQLLLAELDRFAFSGYDRDGTCVYYPILMTGDFNSKPYSTVTKLMSDGRLPYLDENGDIMKLLRRKGMNALLPRRSGISDQCQHYKIILERFRKWKTLRTNNFELDLKSQESLVNLHPYLGVRGILMNSTTSSDCLISPPGPDDDVEIILSPNAEGCDAASSIAEASMANSRLVLTKAADKIAMMNVTASVGNSSTPSMEQLYFPPEQMQARLEMNVLDELSKCGLTCEFDSGVLTHNFNFRDIYNSKLDRQGKDNEMGVTTKQSGWTCVDYIYQSMTWHSTFNKMVEGKLKLIRRLGLFSRSECKQMGDIPNEQHPSDHFPLVAEFLLRQ